MKIYTFPTVCDICGEEGMCSARDAGAQWLGGTMRHSNPQVCADNLRWRREQEEAKKLQGEEIPCPCI